MLPTYILADECSDKHHQPEVIEWQQEQEQQQQGSLNSPSVNRAIKDCVLVIEDLQENGGGYLGFCGALEPQGATTTTTAAATAAATTTTTALLPDAYVCAQKGRDIDASTARLLLRALHGWLGGPEAARTSARQVEVAAARRRKLGGTGGSGGGGVLQGARIEDNGDCHDEKETEEGEMVDWVDTQGRVICALPRPTVHANNVLHRGAGVMIRNEKVGEAPLRSVTISRYYFTGIIVLYSNIESYVVGVIVLFAWCFWQLFYAVWYGCTSVIL